MNNNPIGIFDSGLGGLTVVPHLLRALPEERIVYFGDTARTPYGSKSVETIKDFSAEIVEFLKSQACKLIVIACNTVSSTALEDLRERFPDLPFVGIVDPMVEELAEDYKAGNLDGKKLAVIGTKATINSGIYANLIAQNLPQLELVQQACPLFVPIVEEGVMQTAILDEAIRYYLDDLILNQGVDALILGCTHYHLLEDKIHEFYPNLKIYNPAKAQAKATAELLEKHPELKAANNDSAIPNSFYASDLSPGFLDMIEQIVGADPFRIDFKEL